MATPVDYSARLIEELTRRAELAERLMDDERRRAERAESRLEESRLRNDMMIRRLQLQTSAATEVGKTICSTTRIVDFHDFLPLASAIQPANLLRQLFDRNNAETCRAIRSLFETAVGCKEKETQDAYMRLLNSIADREEIQLRVYDTHANSVLRLPYSKIDISFTGKSEAKLVWGNLVFFMELKSDIVNSTSYYEGVCQLRDRASAILEQQPERPVTYGALASPEHIEFWKFERDPTIYAECKISAVGRTSHTSRTSFAFAEDSPGYVCVRVYPPTHTYFVFFFYHLIQFLSHCSNGRRVTPINIDVKKLR